VHDEVVPTVYQVTVLRHSVESSAFSADESKRRNIRSIVIFIPNHLNVRMVRTGTWLLCQAGMACA